MALNYKDIKVGDVHFFECLVSEEMVDRFAELTGDKNPLHVNEEYARKTEFGGRIVHGMLAGSLFSTLVGMFCPGEKALYLSQELKFKRPLRPNTAVIVEGRVLGKSDAAKIITLATSVKDKEGAVYIEGKALVKVREEDEKR